LHLGKSHLCGPEYGDDTVAGETQAKGGEDGLRIALCGIVKDEIRSIVEWLAHYKALGFTDFLIYDNESTDGTTEILRVLEEAGELVHLDWPHAVGLRPQRLAYEHARRHSDVDWLAYFDVDEFLNLRQDPDIGHFMARFDPDVSAIAINWVVFGSGGQETYRPVPVVERFTDALPGDDRLSHTVKSIARRQSIVGSGIHLVDPDQGRYVNPSGRDVRFQKRQGVWRPDVRVAALHHYSIKSREEYVQKRARGGANTQAHDDRRAKLDRNFAAYDAGGVRNDELTGRSGPMRAEALRLRGVLEAAGLWYPVWPS
jgi:glycosyltransferase involved in cell wall biosynthesis